MDTVKDFAQSLVKAREAYEEDTRKDILRRIESLCSRWRDTRATGWDVNGSYEAQHDFEKALDILVEVHEIMMEET